MNVAMLCRWLLILEILALCCPPQATAITNVVKTLADNGTGSLRDAISVTPRGGTITFAVTGTVVLATGELTIGKDLIIRGLGVDKIFVSGNRTSRVFRIVPLVSLNLSDLTVYAGTTTNALNALVYGQAGETAFGGGGILNEGTLSAVGCWFLENGAGSGGNGLGNKASGGNGGSGGAIVNLDRLLLTNCVFTGNATGHGGNGGAGGSGNIVPDGSPLPAGSGGNGGTGGNGAAILNRGLAIAYGCVFSNNIPGAGGNGGPAGSMGWTGGGGGIGPGAPGTNGYGGKGGSSAILNENGLLTIVACLFANNASGNGGRQRLGGGFSPLPGLNFGIRTSAGIGGDGGAIGNGDMAFVSGSRFFGNTAGGGGVGVEGSSSFGLHASDGWLGGNGGAIINFGSMTITSTSFFENHGGAGGAGGVPGGGFTSGNGGGGGMAGAIYAAAGDLFIDRCKFDYNSAGAGGLSGNGLSSGPGGDGGTLVSIGNTFVTNSSFSNSRSAIGSSYGRGGAILNLGMLALSSCTISSNVCGNGYGGGVYSYTPAGLFLTSCTIIGNDAYYGSSIANFGNANSFLRNCVLAGSFPVERAFFGGIASAGYNFLPSSSGITSNTGTDIVTANDPLLGPLGDYGGGTLSHLPARGSPVLDAGDDSLTGTDQRGSSRKSGPHVDIGACELTLPSTLGLSRSGFISA